VTRLLVLIVTLLVSQSLWSFEPREFKSDDDRALFKVLTDELRCAVCQNQNLADSNAQLAVDLRREIHTMIDDGQTHRQITDFMVDRYGEFVLYKPRLALDTILLWFAPVILILIGLVVIFYTSRRISLTSDDHANESLSPDRQSLARARKLLDDS